MIEIGQNAPALSLYNSNKELVELGMLKGKNIVLLFFPQAFTGTCTKELCFMRDHLHDYTDLNAEVFAISVDSVYTLHKWKELEGFNFHMLSDFNKEASVAYHSIYENFNPGMKGVSKRSAFVIDKEGVVQYAEVLDNAGEIPNLEAVKSVLADLS